VRETLIKGRLMESGHDLPNWVNCPILGNEPVKELLERNSVPLQMANTHEMDNNEIDAI
jgi:hypothetical protein